MCLSLKMRVCSMFSCLVGGVVVNSNQCMCSSSHSKCVCVQTLIRLSLLMCSSSHSKCVREDVAYRGSPAGGRTLQGYWVAKGFLIA
jgi:hypothetical protein